MASNVLTVRAVHCFHKGVYAATGGDVTLKVKLSFKNNDTIIIMGFQCLEQNFNLK